MAMNDKRLAELTDERPTDRPDEYTNLWWRQQTKGIMHSLNRCNAEYSSAQDQIEALQRRFNDLEAKLTDCYAEIGKLRDEFGTSLEKIREAYRDLNTRCTPG